MVMLFSAHFTVNAVVIVNVSTTNY